MDAPKQDVTKLAELLKVLASDTRLSIIRLLRQQPLCVGALAARLDITQGAVSQHLRILRSANLVQSDKRGYFVHYRLNDEALGDCREALDQLLAPQPGQSEHTGSTSEGG